MDDSSLEGDKPDGSDEAEPLSGWRRSTFCGSNGHCVEVARLVSGHIGVRDSKTTDGPVLRLTPDVWTAFLADIRRNPSSD
jgi:hypothetical protein